MNKKANIFDRRSAQRPMHGLAFLDECVYLCQIKIIGMPFVLLEEDDAKAWVAKDPESRYYDKVKIGEK